MSQLTAELIHFPFIKKTLYGRSLNLKGHPHDERILTILNKFLIFLNNQNQKLKI
ncbi:hypothetical protein J591_0839 [Acinetobacter baumannii 532279]|nr:hypothetical protein J591_0839 [Acinetobacter baumannii 532279]CAA6832135.1 Uncharacterised protein [Acinetobacter baumannii ATCC 17978]